MARTAKRLKVNHETTAAYAASQPLFDVLRNAVTRIDEQHAHLVAARDAVQRTHIKLDDSLPNGGNSQNYLVSITKAWRAATHSFMEVFGELANITAAVPSEGKAAREYHEGFARLAKIQSNTMRQAESWILLTGEASGSAESSAQPNEETNIEVEDEDEVTSDVLEARATESVRRIMKPEGMDNSKENIKQAARRQKVEEARSKHEKKMLALRAKKKQGQRQTSTDQPDGPNCAANGTNGCVNDPNGAAVEYEDIHTQVEERLKAKHAKREAAKKEKKRKRDSGDSVLEGGVRNGGVVAKKSRQESAGGGSDVMTVNRKQKRNSGGLEDVGGGRRKRVKTKG